MSLIGKVFRTSKTILDPREQYFLVLGEFEGRYFDDSFRDVRCVVVLWSFGKVETFPASWIKEDGDEELHER